jgi:hypothetical protein
MARHRSGQTQRGQFIAIGTAGLLTALGFVRAAPPSLTLPITVHCTTAEARVYMDDVELGRTGETLAVPFGRDVPLVVSAPYHIPANIFLPCLVPGDPPLELPVRLEPLPASLVVAAQSPSRLRKTTTGCLAINGRDLGEVHLPFVTNHLPPGDYHITLNVQGYQVPPERTVALPPGQQTRVLFELDYLESILRFNVTPSNAAIRVGMENVTNADRSCHVVPHRIYDIVVTAPGYYPARFEDAAMPGERRQLNLRMTPLTYLILDPSPPEAVAFYRGRRVTERRIEVPAGQVLRLEVRAPGYEPQRLEVTLEPGEQRVLRVELKRKGLW